MAEQDIKVVGLSNLKTKKKVNWKIISAIVGIIILALGIVAGILLVRQQQDLREKAEVLRCPEAEQCPVVNDRSHLRNCHPPQSDGSPDEILCRLKGLIAVCGTKEFCCPDVGKNWTTDLSLCAGVETPTPLPTPSGTITCTTGISDNFDTTIDAEKWIPFGQTASIKSGELNFSLGTTNQEAQSVGLITNKAIKGDFSIEVDMNDLTRTGSGVAATSLVLRNMDNTATFTVSRSASASGTHRLGASFNGTLSGNARVDLTSTDSLRVKVDRISGKISAYYKTTGDYVSLFTSSNNFSFDINGVILQLFTSGAPAPQASVNIDNFVLTCPNISSTPTGSSAATATATSSSGTRTSTPTATSTSTSTSGTRTSTPTATSTSTSSTSSSSSSTAATASPAPVPVTGANWPTIIGTGFGILMILASFVLAL